MENQTVKAELVIGARVVQLGARGSATVPDAQTPLSLRLSDCSSVPVDFSLDQNYPNPFNPATTIEFYLVQPSVVTMKLYNTLGQEVATLIDKQDLEEGWNQVRVAGDALNLASGVYFYRLVAQTATDDENPVSQTYTIVKKMMMLKKKKIMKQASKELNSTLKE